MANWRYHSKASIDPYSPRAHGTCDRCSQIVTHSTLKWEMEYRGIALMRTGFLVCPRCLDVPYQGNRPIIIPADPVPIQNPRTENFALEASQGTSFTPPPSLQPSHWDEGGEWDTSGDTWDA